MLHGSALVIFRPWYCSSHLLMFRLGCRRVLACGGSYARSAFFAPAHCARHARWYSFCVLRRSRLLSLCSCMLQLLHAPPCGPLLAFRCCASGVLLNCPVTVVSVLISSFGFAFCSVCISAILLYPDQWGFWEWLGQTPRLCKSRNFLLPLLSLLL
jgi:hypothetical protein